MTLLDDLVESVREEGCLVVSNKRVRDVCLFDHLKTTVLPQIKKRLAGKKIAFGSKLSPDQDGHILLYDNREDSDIRQLLNIASEIMKEKFYVSGSYIPTVNQLKLACKHLTKNRPFSID